MMDATAMIMADRAVRHHVLSARPSARTTPERAAPQRAGAVRLLTVAALRRLADRLEPHRVTTCTPAS